MVPALPERTLPFAWHSRRSPSSPPRLPAGTQRSGRAGRAGSRLRWRRVCRYQIERCCCSPDQSRYSETRQPSLGTGLHRGGFRNRTSCGLRIAPGAWPARSTRRSSSPWDAPTTPPTLWPEHCPVLSDGSTTGTRHRCTATRPSARTRSSARAGAHLVRPRHRAKRGRALDNISCQRHSGVMQDVEVIESAQAAAVALDPVRARLLGELADPGSAAGLAARVGITRQKVNYHLKALEAHGLVKLAEERRHGGITERVLQASSASYVVSPAAVSASAADPDANADHLSAGYLVAWPVGSCARSARCAPGRRVRQAPAHADHRHADRLPIGSRPGRLRRRPGRRGARPGRALPPRRRAPAPARRRRPPGS